MHLNGLITKTGKLIHGHLNALIKTKRRINMNRDDVISAIFIVLLFISIVAAIAMTVIGILKGYL
jgi:hypothetical protein